MSDIRTIYLEIVRSGPSHNQLLSPLTRYLALCGDFPAADVSVPQEHRHFLRRLRDLQYTGTTDSEQHRRSSLDELGYEMAQLLRQVPGLAVGLSAAQRDKVVLTHLQLVMSAAELALLPFELSDVPWGCPGGEKNRLLLQNEVPICITRQVRGISRDPAPWRRKPRILFVAAPGGRDIPLEAHTQALLASIMPWVRIDPEKEKTPSGVREAIADMLTILPDATLYDVAEVCRQNAYTHVHVLAHGEEDGNSEERAIGLAMATSRGGTDIVTGDRFATALKTACTTEQGEPACLPTVVTLATCRGAAVQDIVYTGASFAHELHQAGIPLVVASQFPLTFEGSVHMVKVLYRELLWGEDPRIIIHTLHRNLYALHAADTHDWASLVAYTALPHNLESELENTRYSQARDAIEAALYRLDKELDQFNADSSKCQREIVEAGLQRVDYAAKHLPTEGFYSTEGNGLLGATEKRKAELWFGYAKCVGQNAKDYEEAMMWCCDALRKSRNSYRSAIQGSLRASKETPQVRTPRHWVLVQHLCLGAVIGENLREDHWRTARASAEMDLSADDRSQAEAHSSLAELCLLQLVRSARPVPQEIEKPSGTGRRTPKKASLSAILESEMAQESEKHIRSMVARATAAEFPFIIYATRRQLRRYYDWWGTADFEAFLRSKGVIRPQVWEESGVNDLARRLAGICQSEV